MQGRHGWQGPQGIGFAWILQNRKRWQHANDVVATVANLPAKKWPWRPCNVLCSNHFHGTGGQKRIILLQYQKFGCFLSAAKSHWTY
jgi:hypothetical protein